MNNSAAAAEPKTAILCIVNQAPESIADVLLAASHRRNPLPVQVETLTHARRLSEHLHVLQPDIVLLAYDLPHTDSLALCRQLKADPLTASSALIMTNIRDEAGAMASLDAGADDLLGDPPQPGEIVARIKLQLRLKGQYDTLLTDNQRLTERLIIQNQALETALDEVNAARQMTDNITYNLTHELRTPLLQVKSAVAMMRSDGANGGAELMSKLIGYASAATKRLEAVVSDLDQLVAAMNPPKFEAFRLEDAVQGALRHLGRNWRWDPTDAVARINVHLIDLPAVYSDRAGVSQVLQQVLDNALKFSPGGEPVEVEAIYADDGLWLSVRDYGIGIDESELTHIFRAFYQVDSSERRKFGGVGIGLTIVKLILAGLGAPYVIESKLGAGTTFRFRLPISVHD